MRLPLCFLAASSIAFAESLTEFKIRHELNDLQWQVQILKSQQEADQRAQQEARLRQAKQEADALPPKWISDTSRRQPDNSISPEGWALIMAYQERMRAERQKLAQPQQQWDRICTLPNGVTVAIPAGWVRLGPAEHAARVAETWERVYQKFPSLRDPSTPAAKGLSAYIDTLWASEPARPLFAYPEWPEIVVNEFGVSQGYLNSDGTPRAR